MGRVLQRARPLTVVLTANASVRPPECFRGGGYHGGSLGSARAPGCQAGSGSILPLREGRGVDEVRGGGNGDGKGRASLPPGVHPLGLALTPLSHRRTFLQAVSSEKVRSTNLNCSVIADVRHDGSEPCVDVLFGDGHRLIMRGAHLTAQEMLTAFASHIQARGAAGSGDKPGPSAER